MRTPLLPVVLLALAGMPARLLSWTPPERVDRKPENYRTYLPCMAAGADGSLHAVWSESPESGFLQKVMYARRQGDTWTIPVNISRDSGDIRTPAIVLDGSGSALVVWSEESHALLRYVRQLGDTWSVPKQCFAQHGVIPRLAVNSQGKAHMLFGEAGGQAAIWYTGYVAADDSWTTPTLVADDAGALGWHDLTIDRNDHLHAVWMNYRTYGIDYSHDDGSGWTEPMALPDPAPEGQSCDPRIACDTSGRPHVVWEERRGENVVYHSRLDGDTWATPFRVYELEGGRPVICCDHEDRIHVIWHWSYGMQYRTRADTSWLEPGVVHPTGGGPCVVAERNLLHLVYRDDWRVFYSRHDASGIAEPSPAVGVWDRLTVSTQPGSLRLGFSLRSAGRVLVQLLDSAGRVVAARETGWLDAGSHELTVSTESMASGAYLCRVTAGSEEVRSAKLTIAR